MQIYHVTYLGIPVCYGTLSECYQSIAKRLGGVERASRVTIKEAMESPYRIVQA